MSGWIRPKRSRRSAPRELSDTPPAPPPTRKPWSQELDFSPPPTQSPPPDSQLDGSYWSSPVTRPPVRRRVALDKQERAILKRYRRDAEDVDDVDDEGDARQVLAPASQTSTRRGRGGAVAPWDGRQADDIVEEEEEEEEHEHEHELHESIVEDGPDAHAAVVVGVAEDEEDIVSSSQHTPGVPARVAPSVAASRFSRFQVEPRRGDAQQYRLVQADAEPEPVVAMRDFRQQLLLPSSAPRTRWSELYQAAVAKASADARGWIVYALDASTVVFANDVHGDSPSLLALVGGGQPPLGVALHVVTSAGAVCSCVRTSSALLVCRMCVLAPHSSGERLESARVADLLRGRTHIDAPVSVAADFDWITVVPALARSQSTSQMRARTDAAPVVESDSLSVSPLLDAHSQQPGHWLGVDPRGSGRGRRIVALRVPRHWSTLTSVWRISPSPTLTPFSGHRFGFAESVWCGVVLPLATRTLVGEQVAEVSGVDEANSPAPVSLRGLSMESPMADIRRLSHSLEEDPSDGSSGSVAGSLQAPHEEEEDVVPATVIAPTQLLESDF